MKIYALAAYRLLGIPLRSCVLYYLKNGRQVVTDIPRGAGAGPYFEKLEKQICDFQEKILDFSNKRGLETKP
jgi:hypothetical protein